MKSILYVGATLMIGASIYGFVDSKKVNRNKELSNMYKESPVPEAVTVVTNDKTGPAVKKEMTSIRKKAETKKQALQTEEYVKPIKPIAEEDKISLQKRKGIEETPVDVTISKEDATEKNVKKKRKFSTKLFSRGALDERYVTPKEKADLPKKE